MIKLVPSGKSSYTVYFEMNGIRHLSGEFYCEIDGYYVWLPILKCGYLRAEWLQLIVNSLNELNSGWDKQLEEFFNNSNGSEANE